MKPHNPSDERIINWQYVIRALFVICFVWTAGCAFQASEYTIGCISLFMAWLAPVLLGDSDE